MVYKFFDKKAGSRAKQRANEKLSQELHKPVIKKLKKGKVYDRFKDNIWAADLAEMRSFMRSLLCAIDVFTRYAWVKPFKDKKN